MKTDFKEIDGRIRNIHEKTWWSISAWNTNDIYVFCSLTRAEQYAAQLSNETGDSHCVFVPEIRPEDMPIIERIGIKLAEEPR